MQLSMSMRMIRDYRASYDAALISTTALPPLEKKPSTMTAMGSTDSAASTIFSLIAVLFISS